MKARGFTIEQHNAAGRHLFKMNLDLCNIHNILYAAYPVEHSDLFQRISKFNDALFALRNKLDDYACKETRSVSYLYFLRNDDGTAPGLDKPLEGCSPEVFEQLMTRNREGVMPDSGNTGLTPDDYRPIQASLQTAGDHLARLALALYVAYRDPKFFELALATYYACMGLRLAILTTILKTNTLEELEAVHELLTAMTMLKNGEVEKKGQEPATHQEVTQ